MNRRRLLLRLVLAQESALLGGQAVLEGVMMRSPKAFAVAVRRPDGTVAMLSETIPSWTVRFPWLKVPVLRGAAVLIQSLALGIRALNFSTENAFPEEATAEPVDTTDDPVAAESASAARTAAKKTGGIDWQIWGSLALAMVMGIGLFFLLPLALTQGLHLLWPALGNGVRFNLVEGLIRVAIFLGYMLLIGLMPDIKRLFRYHGAEHKVVHAYEAKRGMDVATVQSFTTFHPRCGTSFLLIVMLVSVGVFSLIPGAWPLWAKAASRLVLVPFIAGLSYEVIRFTAKHMKSGWALAVAAPGMWLQRITTAPPDDAMIEVALAAFDRACEIEGNPNTVVL
ncbi:MAG: DUF1385 domain-containing protein [Acidobacteriota bacterium]